MDWTRIADYIGSNTVNGLGFYFYINGYGYAGGTTSPGGGQYAQEFYRYDPINNTWLIRTPPYNFGITNLYASTNLDYNGLGYVLGGFQVGNTYITYNPLTDSWNLAAGNLAPTIDSAGREYAAGAVSGAYIYWGGGYKFVGFDKRYKDWWKLDPATNIWTQLTDMPNVTGSPGARGRSDVRAVTIGTTVYVLGGLDGFGLFSNQLSAYDTLTDTWSEMTPCPLNMTDISVFATDTDIYVTGFGDLTVYSWKQSSDKWTKENDFPAAAFGGSGPYVSQSFGTGRKWYVGMNFITPTLEWYATDIPFPPTSYATSFASGRSNRKRITKPFNSGDIL